jgi:hypothetical protein
VTSAAGTGEVPVDPRNTPASTVNASEINADNYGSGSGSVLSLRGDNQFMLSNGSKIHAMAMSSGNDVDVMLSTRPTVNISADAATTLITDTLIRATAGRASPMGPPRPPAMSS